MSDVRTQADLLFSSIDARLQELGDLEKKAQLLAETEADVRLLEKEILGKQKDLENKVAELEQQKKFIASENDRLKREEIKQKKHEDYLAAIRVEAADLESLKGEIRRKEIDVEDKIKLLDSLQEQEKELARREALVTKSEVIDRERKRLLDLREHRIQAEWKRLRLDDAFTTIPQE